MYAIILAGGCGSRLWPISRLAKPKQALKIIGNQTLLQQTYARLRKVLPAEQIIIVPTKDHARSVRQQLAVGEKYHLVIEPAARGTGTAIGLALAYIKKIAPDSTVVTINSDAYVKNENNYCNLLKKLSVIVDKHPDILTLVGLPPTYPETGYGYIECFKKIDSNEHLLKVKKFIEKPNLARAKLYVAKKKYLWNPTIIAAKTEIFWQVFSKCLPEHAKILLKQKGYTRLPNASLDYDILEKQNNMQVVIARNWGWSDVGHWRTVKEILSKYPQENVGTKHIVLDAKGNLLLSTADKLITAIGVENLAIIDTQDVLLVCPLNRAQEVRQMVDLIRKTGITKHL